MWKEYFNILKVLWPGSENLGLLSLDLLQGDIYWISYIETGLPLACCTSTLEAVMLPGSNDIHHLNIPSSEEVSVLQIQCWYSGSSTISGQFQPGHKSFVTDQVKLVLNLKVCKTQCQIKPLEKEIQFQWLPTPVCMRFYLFLTHYPQYQCPVCFNCLWIKCCSEKEGIRLEMARKLYPQIFSYCQNFFTPHCV